MDDNTREESEKEIVGENLDIFNDEILEKDSAIVPTVGMKFKDENEVFEFYKSYAYHVGFLVRKRNSKKDDDGNVRYVTITCCRESRRSSITSTSLKPQPTI
ncbi:Protein FAR1-RELATED SEQUENCE [Abeliophyllum distichum]|uniref:Protein FAR1-RELATED SEQUENCE n=1 Tax=Abeliophyllum distichum TaxID=126358 RepID=A0ABD1V8P9_9LAMI